MNASKLNFAHLCDMAFLSEEKKLCIIGIFEQIWTKKFPIMQQRLNVVLNLTTHAGAHHFEILLTNRHKEKPLFTLDGNITLKQSESINLILDFPSVNIPEAGGYSLEIIFDGESLGKIPFMARLADSKDKKLQ